MSKAAFFLGLLLALFVSGESRAEPYSPAAGDWKVDTLSLEWTDAARQREVPVKIYFARDKTTPSPVVIFSHGLGGSREGYEFLGRYWAGRGIVSVHLQHGGSDSGVFTGGGGMAAMARAAANPANAINRPLDVSFAIDELTALAAADVVWRGRLDLERIGVAGHSFGANTSLLVAGMTMGPQRRSFFDKRVKAAIALSAPVPRPESTDIYAPVGLPILHMTGTLDDSPVGDTKAAARRVPFDKIAGVPQYLVIFKGGDHMIFSGQRFRGPAMATDAGFHEQIRAGSAAFWDAYLLGNAEAKEWLAGGGYAKMLGESATLEIKAP